jgi:4-hydroxy-4-methyl-2-oxoglutarate aldolase
MVMSSPDPTAPNDVLRSTATVAMICDALDALGVRNQALDPLLRPIKRPARLEGRARTVEFVPTEEEVDADDPYGEMINFIDTLAVGDVAVIAAHGSARSGCWGELFTAAASGRGAAGVVCDGYVRDTDKVARMQLPVFARGRRPYDFRARLRVIGRDIAVFCGGVNVGPGDLVVGDDDGVVAVPRALEAAIVEAANARATRESTVLTELLSGCSLREVWDRHRLL